MIVWGGINYSDVVLNDGGRYDPVADTWAATTQTNAPSARYYPTSVWTGSKMIVWGGFDDIAAKRRRRPVRPGREHLDGHDGDGRGDDAATTMLRSGQARGWSSGAGTTEARALNDGWRYDPVGDAWATMTSTNAPSARFGHTAIWTGSKMVVWGGVANNTGGLYDPAANTWAATTTVNAPAIRYYYSVVWTGSKMLLWGGSTFPSS